MPILSARPVALAAMLAVGLAPLAAQGGTTILHSFMLLDGRQPECDLVRDAAGTFYGSTYMGGLYNAGTVFKLDAKGVETVLYSFTCGTDGCNPEGGVILDRQGNLYGTTSGGGPSVGREGVVYRVSPDGHETVIHAFHFSDGAEPLGPLTFDARGNLYGTTFRAGPYRGGTVFKLAPNGTETVLHYFGQGHDGFEPSGKLRLDTDGNVYGTTYQGGAAGDGTVFRLSQSGQETILHTFSGGSDGRSPGDGVTADAAGNLYGTTIAGGIAPSGATDFGTAYKISGDGRETVLHAFGDSGDGTSPAALFTIDRNGDLISTTDFGGSLHGGGFGTVFKMTPSGAETVLHDFAGHVADGAYPHAGVLIDTLGVMYGTTSFGGAHRHGTVYELTP